METSSGHGLMVPLTPPPACSVKAAAHTPTPKVLALRARAIKATLIVFPDCEHNSLFPVCVSREGLLNVTNAEGLSNRGEGRGCYTQDR